MLRFTPIDEIPALVARCRVAFKSGVLSDVEDRKRHLRRLDTLFAENEEQLCAAVAEDFGKPRFETNVMELNLIRNEIADMLNNLDEWAKPAKAETGGIEFLDDNLIKPDARGTVLIIGAWNFPYQLLFVAVAGAIAAGNTVVIKPSEVAPRSASLIDSLVSRYFAGDAAGVMSTVNGAVAETTALLEERFDYIFYTGSARIGKIIMTAAAKHLTPVTLELGGKSPVVVDDSCPDLRTAARRILWGKFVNAGQVCVGPDYVLVHPRVKQQFIVELRKARDEFFGGDEPLTCRDFTRIVNRMHFERLMGLLRSSVAEPLSSASVAADSLRSRQHSTQPDVVESGDAAETSRRSREPSGGHRGVIVVGGEWDESRCILAPTVVDEVTADSPLMADELFGPILPLVSCGGVAEAAQFINAREKPLALYVFASRNRAQVIIDGTSSGAVVMNDTLVHTSVAGLPFGGVGQSGMGAYHGKLTFDTFSHKKAVLHKLPGMEPFNRIRYPPYTEGNLRKVNYLVTKREHECCNCCCFWWCCCK